MRDKVNYENPICYVISILKSDNLFDLSKSVNIVKVYNKLIPNTNWKRLS